jgi:transcriptional regulator with XRE-family HTH domain
MGYSERLQKLCALRSLDQATLASMVGLSKWSISRILTGVQEPKLSLANDLAKALGVTLDYLMDDSLELAQTQRRVIVTDEELMILKIVRRLGPNAALDRLLAVGPPAHRAEVEAQGAASALVVPQLRAESSRFAGSSEDPSGT